MAHIQDTDDIVDTRTLTDAVTIIGVFPNSAGARTATQDLEREGFAPDRIGIVADNVRQAREVAGSYSPQGALAGAMLGALLTAAYIVFGGESVRQNPAGILIGGLALLVAFTAIGWLAGRARIFKRDEYNEFEDHVEQGDVLLSVVCSTAEGADRAKAMLERAGATDVRLEGSAESV